MSGCLLRNEVFQAKKASTMVVVKGVVTSAPVIVTLQFG